MPAFSYTFTAILSADNTYGKITRSDGLSAIVPAARLSEVLTDIGAHDNRSMRLDTVAQWFIMLRAQSNG